MANPHCIRLRGPWSYGLADGSSGRLTLPADWNSVLPHTACGPQQVRFSRRFQAPHSLSAAARVDLVVQGLSAPVQISLNGHPLGWIQPSAESPRLEITAPLRASNQLQLELPLDPAQPCLGEVCLEITAHRS